MGITFENSCLSFSQTSGYTEQEQNVLAEFIELQLPSTCFTWRIGMVSSEHFIHYFFYGSNYYPFFTFLTYAKDTNGMALSSYQDENMRLGVKQVVTSRAKDHLVSFIYSRPPFRNFI